MLTIVHIDLPHPIVFEHRVDHWAAISEDLGLVVHAESKQEALNRLGEGVAILLEVLAKTPGQIRSYCHAQDLPFSFVSSSSPAVSEFRIEVHLPSGGKDTLSHSLSVYEGVDNLTNALYAVDDEASHELDNS